MKLLLTRQARADHKRALMLERLFEIKKVDGTWESYNKRIKERNENEPKRLR